MRQPTFKRRRARQQRLLRTGLGVVVLVGVAALAVSLIGGDEEPAETEPTPQVAFRTRATAYADHGTMRRADRVEQERVADAAELVTQVMNTWYQRTFVDPDVFEVSLASEDELSYPPPDASRLLSDEAAVAVAADLNALTLGEQRTSFARVEPGRSRADVTFLFEGARRPTMAVAEVTFEAVATLKDPTAFPVAIVHQATFHLLRDGRRWRIAFYDATNELESIVPPPTPTQEATG